MSNRLMIFIESNTSGTGPRFINAAREEGLRPVMLTADSSRYDYALEEELTVCETDTSDEEALFETCHLLSRNGRIAGILSSSEYYVSAAAALAARFGLSCPSAMAVSRCRDKEEQRKRLLAAGVPVPAFRAADSAGAAVEAATEIGLPVVLKPVVGSGSVGVMLCENLDEVSVHARRLLDTKINERGLRIPGRILVEELACGPEFSVETFGSEVIGVTKKYLTPLPRFIETGHDFRAQLTPEVEKVVGETALRALQALKLEWGPAHIEIRLSLDGPNVIEVNPRLAGGHIPELVRLSSGIDLISATIKLAIGKRASLKPNVNFYSSIRFILPNSEGRLMSIEGLEKAARTPGVVEVKPYRQVGAELRLHGDFRDRIGHVIARGASPDDARESAERAHSAVKLVIESEICAQEDVFDG